MENCKDNTTLYISNLNERVAVNELRKALFAVFSQCGKISDIFASKRYKLRGQAWIEYSDSHSAANAFSVLQGLPFYSKPMNIAFALKFPSSKERSKSYSFKSARKMKRTPSSSITTTKKNGIGVGVGKESKEEDKRERDETTKSAILSIKGLPGFTKLYSEVSWIYFLMSRSHHRSNAITFIQTIPRFSKR